MNIWIIGLLKMNVNPDSVHIHFSFEGAGPFYKGKSDGAVYSVRSLIFLNGFSSRLLEKRERRLGHFGLSRPKTQHVAMTPIMVLGKPTSNTYHILKFQIY